MTFNFQQLIHYDEELDVTVQTELATLIGESRQRGYSFYGGYGKVPRVELFYWWIQSGDPTLFPLIEAYLKKRKIEYSTTLIKELGVFIE